MLWTAKKPIAPRTWAAMSGPRRSMARKDTEPSRRLRDDPARARGGGRGGLRRAGRRADEARRGTKTGGDRGPAGTGVGPAGGLLPAVDGDAVQVDRPDAVGECRDVEHI